VSRISLRADAVPVVAAAMPLRGASHLVAFASPGARLAADVCEEETARMAVTPVALHRFVTERAGSRRTVELEGEPHSGATPEAAAVAELVEEAAAATSAAPAARA